MSKLSCFYKYFSLQDDFTNAWPFTVFMTEIQSVVVFSFSLFFSVLGWPRLNLSLEIVSFRANSKYSAGLSYQNLRTPAMSPSGRRHMVSIKVE